MMNRHNTNARSTHSHSGQKKRCNLSPRWWVMQLSRHRAVIFIWKRAASWTNCFAKRWSFQQMRIGFFFVWHRSGRDVSSLPSSWATRIVYFSMYVTAMVTIQTWVCLSCVPSWGQRDGKMKKRLLGQALNRIGGKPKDKYGTDIRQNWQARTISEFCFKRENYSAWVWMQFTIFSRRRILTHLNVSLFFFER